MTLNADDGIALANGPGYLDLDGSRYMTIAHSSDFDIEAGRHDDGHSQSIY